MDLFWHRRDLRVPDNRGLATSNTSVLPVFVLDPAVLDYSSPNRTGFLLRVLSALREDYRAIGGDLVIRYGDPDVVIPDLADDHDVAAVRWSRGYSGLARRQAARVAAALDENGIANERVDDALLHEPGSVMTNDGDPYAVFSYFWKKWRTLDKPASVGIPDDVVDVPVQPIPNVRVLEDAEPAITLPTSRRNVAMDRLEDFCAGPIYRYGEDRDYPSRGGTSRLSTVIRFGVIGIRAIWEATETALRAADSEGARTGVEEFRRQLAWREFYTHALWFNPAMVTESVRTPAHPIEWRNDPDEFEAWMTGQTGYPFVDAGMRQLLTEGWMHNRLRMVVASFLTKDLMIDWRRGYEHFRRHLIDHDPANDAGGWQWAASTGIDAQPYFRIFNPMTQGKRYDPDATYITRYVPELDGVRAPDIHRWPELDEERRRTLAPDYPDPLVDHTVRREAALGMFERARNGA